MTSATRPPPPALPRDEVPVAAAQAYLDTASMSPVLRSVAEAMAEDCRRAGLEGSRGLARRAERAEEVRAAAARVLGTGADDVALVGSTTQGIGLVAAGLDWRAGDRVVVAEGDHPAIVAPWRARVDVGVEVVAVPTDEAGAVDPVDVAAVLEDGAGRVRVVAVSWVRADRGHRVDLAGLADLAHAHGALLCVDLIQGLGAVPCALDRWGVDAAAAGAQKWLLGPHGAGVAHLSPSLRERLRVLAPSHHGMGPGTGPLALGPTARRHESGTLNHVGLAGMGAGLELLEAAGVGAVADAVDDLAGGLAEGLAALGAEVLTDRTPPHGSGIVAVRLPDLDADEAVARLDAADVVVSARAGAVRLAPHAWNDATDVATALDAVAHL